MRYILILCSLFILGCSTEEEHPDKPYEGEMTIAVDENYAKVMDEQIRIFQNQYPKASINVLYKNETDCIRSLVEKEAKMIIVSRYLNTNEKTVAEQAGASLSYGELARDGIALISSTSSAIKNLKTEEVFIKMSNKDKSGTSIVFENANAGNALYFSDSILKNTPLNKRAYSAGSVDSVISYVSTNPQSIGVLNMTNILNPSDKDIAQKLKNTQIIGVKTDSSEYYWQPYPLYVASKSYPYVKSLSFILNEGYQGLGHSFANYLSKEQGQLLFHSYDLFPLKYNVVNREVQIVP